MAGKLFQEYTVDSWATSEQSHLNWVRLNQTKLRAETYQGLTDAVVADPTTDGVTTSTDSGFTAMTRASQYLIMPKHMSKELAEPMNINWKTSSIHRFENG